jgi:hypothetical protein
MNSSPLRTLFFKRLADNLGAPSLAGLRFGEFELA